MSKKSKKSKPRTEAQKAARRERDRRRREMLKKQTKAAKTVQTDTQKTVERNAAGVPPIEMLAAAMTVIATAFVKMAKAAK